MVTELFCINYKKKIGFWGSILIFSYCIFYILLVQNFELVSLNFPGAELN